MTIYFDENKKAYGFEINNYIATVDDATWIKYADTDQWDILNGIFTDISETDEYKAKVRLAEIEAELNSADDTYTTYLDTPVQYINGFYYKPKYVQETYISLITAGTINPSLFPMVIWDSAELEENAVSMSLSELISLTTYLAGVQQIAFNSRKQQRASLIAEQQSLLQSS